MGGKRFGIKVHDWSALTQDVDIKFLSRLIRAWAEKGKNVLFVGSLRGFKENVLLVAHMNNCL